MMIALAWERFVVLVLVAALGALTLSGLAACGFPQKPPPAAALRGPWAVTVRVAPAIIGNISVSTAYAAIVEAKDQVNLVPLATGRVEKLYADFGSEVQRGQVIAELSHGTLDAQLQQAQAGLRNAQAKLASVQGAAKPNQIKAQAQLDATRTKLRQLLSPSPLDLEVAASATDKAKAELQNAKTKLDQLLNPSDSDLQAAQSAVATTQANLDSAKTKLDQLLNPSPAEVAAARAAVAEAQSKFATAQANFDQAIANLLSSKESMTAEHRLWWQTVLQARLSLEAITATLNNLHETFGWAPSSTEVANARQIVNANQAAIATLLEQLNSPPLIPQGIRTAMWAELSAQAALENARAKLRELQNPNQNTVALAQYNVAKEQAALDSAKAKLKELQHPSQTSIALAKHNVDTAQASLDAAVAKLKLLRNPNPADVAAAETAVAVAEQDLAVKQEPYTQQDVDEAQALVDQAQAQVNLVKQQLAETQLLAPFDGFVTRRWLAPGAIASPQTTVFTIAGKVVVVSLRVEETGISSLQKGQRVTFTSPALPGQRLDLQVDQIAPTGDEKAHTFFVQMRPVDATPGLKPGMSGEVSIATRHEKVVLVPKEAVVYRSGQSTVFVVQDGKAQLRKVDGGLLDNKNMEVQNGVQPGDQVVVFGQNLLNEGDQVNLEAPTEPRRPPG